MQYHIYESPFNLLQFHLITNKLVMENITITDLEFKNDTHFIRLVDANSVELNNFIVDQVLLDSYLIWLSQLRSLIISRSFLFYFILFMIFLIILIYGFNYIFRFTVTNIQSSISKLKDFPIINVEAARD